MANPDRDEAFWVSQARQGSDEAFTELVGLYQAPVYNLCYRMLGDPGSAEDAAQETFLRAYRYLHRYDPSRAFATWLLSIAAHYCIDRLRRARYALVPLDAEDSEGSVRELADPESPDPEAEVMKREQQELVQALLMNLEGKDRAAIVMRYWHSISEVEIAEALGLTVSAVKSRLHRARRVLASHWEEPSLRGSGERRPHESPAI